MSLEYMAEAFGVSVKFIDRELANFITAGRIHAKIDKGTKFYIFLAKMLLNFLSKWNHRNQPAGRQKSTIPGCYQEGRFATESSAKAFSRYKHLNLLQVHREYHCLN